MVQFTPTEGGGLHLGGEPAATAYRAVVAVHYGIVVMLALFDEINARNEAGLEEFRERLKTIGSG